MRRKILRARKRKCVQCRSWYEPYKRDQRFCTPLCQHRFHGRKGYAKKYGRKTPPDHGHCGICGARFERVDRFDWLRRYCSDACAKEARKRSRHAFHERNPDYRKRAEFIYHGGWTNSVTRFFRRCPDVPRKCMVCGEDRVVDIHHKKRRNGAPARARNTQQNDVWILCPNHHAMLHRGVATPEELGLA